MKTFEYCSIDWTIDTAKLNELGGQGWQLMIVRDGVCVFMREVDTKAIDNGALEQFKKPRQAARKT